MWKMDLKKSRSLLNVRRLNFERCNRYESVAEHSFYVGLIAYQLAYRAELGESIARLCMRNALMHDLPEAVTGDIPFLLRRALGSVVCDGIDDIGAKELDLTLYTKKDIVAEIVQIADVLEFAIYLKEELMSGNSTLLDIYHETLGRLAQYEGCDQYTDYFKEVLDLSIDEIKALSKEMPHGVKH